MSDEIEILERTDEQKDQDLQPLKRQKASPEELFHEKQIDLLLEKFPNMDPLMASVFLKAPKERLAELLKQPEMWVIPEQQQEKVIFGAVVFDDADAIKRQDF